MSLGIRLAENGRLPDALVRTGIRGLLMRRLEAEHAGDCERRGEAHARFVDELRSSPVALAVDAANEQHYEVPPAFFERVLGPRLKYSACAWPDGVDDLTAAEEATLAMTAERAGIEDGMTVLELGCGWGSMSLWAAEHFPASRVERTTLAAG